MSSFSTRALASKRHIAARTGAHELWWQMVQGLLAQRERRNVLPWLTPEKAEELFGAWLRGETAEIQTVWHMLERYDETLHIVLRARVGAIEDMDWSINIDADAVGETPEMQRLAEAQKSYLLRRLGAVENLRAALRTLALADFHGVAAVELTGAPERMRWENIEPWLLCRPVRNGPWLYNAEADPVPYAPEQLDPARVIIREAEPINLPALFLIVAKRHGVMAWDAFLDRFGIPSVFLETPPNTTEEQAAAFDSVVQELIGEGSGTIPAGAKFHTVETNKDNTEAFEKRAKACDQAIIILATGGLLTVTTEAGSGTLAGNAHAESFARLAAATARDISEVVNFQFCRPALAAAFPGAPVLASFVLSPEAEDERAAQAQIIATLAGAGFKPSAETVSEMMGFEVQAVETPPTPPEQGGQAPFPGPVMNSLPPAAPAPGADILSPAELAALQNFCAGGLSANAVQADSAPYAMALQAMANAIDTPAEAEEKEPRGDSPRGYIGLPDKQSLSDFQGQNNTQAGTSQAPGIKNIDLNEEKNDKATATIANAADCRAADPAHCRVHGEAEQKDAEADAWEQRQAERDELEKQLAELDRQEEAARDRHAMAGAGYSEAEIKRTMGEPTLSLDADGNPLDRDKIEARLAEIDELDKNEEEVENSCNGNFHDQKNHTGAARHKAGHSRASAGDTRGKKDTPKRIQPEDSKRTVKKKLAKNFEEAQKGKNVNTGYEVKPGQELLLRQGDKEKGGTAHAERKEHTMKISSDTLAETVLHGQAGNDRGNDLTFHGKNGVQVTLTPEKEFPTRAANQPRAEKGKGNMVAKNWYRRK